MNKKINIIQFLPYFPPHKGGLETHAEEWGKWWVKKGYGDVYNIVTDFNQSPHLTSPYGRGIEQIFFNGEEIGYKMDGYDVLVVPSFEIISNFPVYKVWSKKYKVIKTYLESKISANKGNKEEQFIVISRTRFFTTSYVGGLFARKNKIKWTHVEHGSDYVKLSNFFKNIIAKTYDRLIGNWIFKNADKVVGLSKACKEFIEKEFIKRKIEVVYRGIELKKSDIEKTGELNLVYVGRLVTLKGVDYLLKSYKELNINIKLTIFGDGPQRGVLEKYAKDNELDIEFLGLQDREYIINYLYRNKCIVINPSYQEGLPSTVVESLMTGNVSVASNVGGTCEISEMDDLILFNAGNIKELTDKIVFSVKNFDKLVGTSRDLVINRFSWEENIWKYYEILK